MNLCKNCVWIRYSKSYPDSMTFSLKMCDSPMYEKKIDPVEGNKLLKECCDMRTDSSLCGESGIFFSSHD